MDSYSVILKAAAGPIFTDMNARIAANVRAMRSEFGMSLDALGTKCDVSDSRVEAMKICQPRFSFD